MSDMLGETKTSSKFGINYYEKLKIGIGENI